MERINGCFYNTRAAQIIFPSSVNDIFLGLLRRQNLLLHEFRPFDGRQLTQSCCQRHAL